VTPSSNSSLAVGLIKLSKFFFDEPYEALAGNMLKAIKQYAVMNPTFHSYWLTTAINLTFPFYEVGVVGDKVKTKREMLSKQFLPNTILFGGENEGSLEILKDRYTPGKTLIYICENRVCQLPVEETEKALKQILN